MSDHDSTDWFQAVRAGDQHLVSRLLAEGSPADARDPAGNTALHLAARAGHLAVVRELLDGGAAIDAAVDDETESGFSVTSVGPGANADFGSLMAEATENADAQTKAILGGLGKLLSFASEASDQELHDLGLVETVPLPPPTSSSVEQEEEDGPDQRYEEYDLATPLNLALAFGHTEVARTLLEAGAAVTSTSWDVTPPLAIAAAEGNTEITRELLSRGAPPDRGFEFAPLHVAAQAGHLEVIDLLLEAGAKVDVEEEDGITPLMNAAFAGHLAVVERLVEAGADPAWIAGGETALASAAREGHLDVMAYLEPLVTEEIREYAAQESERSQRKRARKAQQDPRAETLIHAAMMGDVPGTKNELAAGAPVDSIGENGLTALMYAASYGHLPILEVLLEAGADPEIGATENMEQGQSALMMVAGSFFAANRVEVIERLVRAGADVDHRDAGGRTALHVAISSGSGYSRSVDALLAAGADPNVKTHDGVTPLMLALRQNAKGIVARLREAGAREDGVASMQLLQAAESGNLTGVENALADGADVEVRLDWTPLSVAAMNGHVGVVAALLAAGADPNRAESDPPEGSDEPWHGDFTPLIRAAYGPHLEIVRLLLEAGADPEVKLSGRTARDYALLGKAEGNRQGPWDAIAELLGSVDGSVS